MRTRFASLKARVLKSGVLATFGLYWRLYGGWKALLTSPYLYVSLILTLVCIPLLPGSPPKWADITINVVPNLLGFSIGGMAIALAISNGAVFEALVEGGKNDSLFLKTVANFFHFILIQTLSLCVAVVSEAQPFVPLSFVGCWLFIYGLLAALATCGSLLQVARIFNKSGTKKDPAPAAPEPVEPDGTNGV